MRMTTNNKETLKKIEKNAEIISVIGLGYVGLPLAVNFAEAGVHVIGFEKSKDKTELVNTSSNYIGDIRDAVLRDVVIDKLMLEATTDFTRMKECDALLICVPIPLDRFRKPDMSYIESACTNISQNMKTGTFVSLESTTYPTTTEDLMLPIIEKESGMKHGKDFWLAYSPERVDPGNKDFHTRNTPNVMGAMTKDGVEIGEAIYKKSD
jgi:UDP-N-acetyl-D-glucosamine dehydrogenase